MLESRFVFISKIFFLAFFIINLVNFFPINFFDVSYHFLITSTIFDTATLLALSLVISKYTYIKNFKFVEDFNINSKSNNKDNLIEKGNLLKIQIFNSSRLAFIFSILFLIMTLMQPIILILNLNKMDFYSSSVVSSISKEFDNKKKDIQNIIILEKSKQTELKKINKLNDNIEQLSKIKKSRIEKTLKDNNRLKFNDAKFAIRNFFLGILWTTLFYKIYKI